MSQLRECFDWCLFHKWSSIKYLKENYFISESDSVVFFRVSVDLRTLFLIERGCQNLPGSVRKHIREYLSGLSVANLISCLEQARWYWCHIIFPVCKSGKTKNIWRKIPICRNSCKSYMSIPSCKALLPRIQDYLVARKYCVDISSEEIFYCTYQENITTINCLSSIPSKYFHLNMFYWQCLFNNEVYLAIQIVYTWMQFLIGLDFRSQKKIVKE